MILNQLLKIKQKQNKEKAQIFNFYDTIKLWQYLKDFMFYSDLFSFIYLFLLTFYYHFL